MLLKTTNLSIACNELEILEDVSLDVRKGEFVSLIGPSGCGKTTLLRVLSGLTPSTGAVHYYLPERDRIPYTVAFQDNALYPWLTVLENIVICLNDRDESLRAKRQYATDFLRTVQLDKFSQYYPGELSGGMLQRVNIVRAFSSSAQLIFMDEPFVHLDFLQRNALQKFTLDLLHKYNKTVFFITHNIHEAVTLSDRIYLMSALPGRIVKEFSIPFDRPRDVDSIRKKPEYIDLVANIMDVLRAEMEQGGVLPHG